MHSHPNAYIATSFVLSAETITQFVSEVSRFYGPFFPQNYFDDSNVTVRGNYRVVTEAEATVIDKALEVLHEKPNADLYTLAMCMGACPEEVLRAAKIVNLLSE